MVSLTLVPRYTEDDLTRYQAEKLGMLKSDVAERLLDGIQKSGSVLSGKEKRFLIAALKDYLGK